MKKLFFLIICCFFLLPVGKSQTNSHLSDCATNMASDLLAQYYSENKLSTYTLGQILNLSSTTNSYKIQWEETRADGQKSTLHIIGTLLVELGQCKDFCIEIERSSMGLNWSALNGYEDCQQNSLGIPPPPPDRRSAVILNGFKNGDKKPSSVLLKSQDQDRSRSFSRKEAKTIKRDSLKSNN